MPPDITNLDYPQLNELRTRIDQRMTELRETGLPQLRARFAEDAAALGLSVEEIFGAEKKRGRRGNAHTAHESD